MLGIPRGGVPVAAEVAHRLGAELDVVVARKLRAPGFPELAIGAVTANGGQFLNDRVMRELGVSTDYLQREIAFQMEDARRCEQRFRGGRGPQAIAGRTAIVVDDGLATGATLRAAVRSARSCGPAMLVAAVPVGAAESCAAVRGEVDAFVCLHEREDFWAVGFYYLDFDPVSDEEVERILHESHAIAAREPMAVATVPRSGAGQP